MCARVGGAGCDYDERAQRALAAHTRCTSPHLLAHPCTLDVPENGSIKGIGSVVAMRRAFRGGAQEIWREHSVQLGARPQQFAPGL
jgi:hypothetical protein